MADFCGRCNNTYRGKCFKCGDGVPPKSGHLEYRSKRRWKVLKIPMNINTIVQCCKCRG